MRSALDLHSWDIVIFDSQLPGFDALGALTLLRQRDPDLPFILILDTIDEEMDVAVTKAGASAYVTKKDNFARLVPTVKRELRNANARQKYLTEHRQAEEKLHRSESLRGAILEASLSRSALEPWSAGRNQSYRTRAFARFAVPATPSHGPT